MQHYFHAPPKRDIELVSIAALRNVHFDAKEVFLNVSECLGVKMLQLEHALQSGSATLICHAAIITPEGLNIRPLA